MHSIDKATSRSEQPLQILAAPPSATLANLLSIARENDHARRKETHTSYACEQKNDPWLRRPGSTVYIISFVFYSGGPRENKCLSRTISSIVAAILSDPLRKKTVA